MHVSIETIRSIKPGRIEAFPCSREKMRSAATVMSDMKRFNNLPEGVVEYEHKKFPELGIILIRPLREGDNKVLNI